MRTEADIQDGPDRQHCEQDALQETQRTGQLAEQNLTREGSDEDQRDAVETKCIEGDADRAVHACMPKTRDFPRTIDSRYRSHGGGRLPRMRRVRWKTAPAPGGRTVGRPDYKGVDSDDYRRRLSRGVGAGLASQLRNVIQP